MKRLLTMLLMAGSLAMTGCASQVEKASDTSSKLKEKGYSVTSYTFEEAKATITGLDYDIVSFSDAIFAEKGEGEDKDGLLAFFFASINDANKFMEENSNKNMGLMHDYGAARLGANLTLKVGMHNNVAYVGSETSFATAFN